MLKATLTNFFTHRGYRHAYGSTRLPTGYSFTSYSHNPSASHNTQDSKPSISMVKKLISELGTGTLANVTDVSGGCGSAYNVYVYSPDFVNNSNSSKAMNKITQARKVYKVLSNEISQMHNINVKTFSDKEDYEKLISSS